MAPGDKLGGTAGAFKYLSGDQVTAATLTAGGIVDTGNLTVSGSLSAGSTSVGTLSFSSATSTGSLKVAGDLTVTGVSTFTGNVAYTGGALLDTATTTGSFAAGGTFFVQGDNGHVGIGLSSPTSTLTVLQSGTATNAITIRAVSAPAANLFQLEDSSGTFLSGFTGAGGLFVNIASTTALNIQNGSGTPVFTLNTIDVVAGIATTTPVATFAIATTTDTTTGAAAAFYIDQRSSLGNSPTVPTAYIYASSTQPALQIAVPPGSSNAGNLVLLQGASAQNSNILQVNNASGSFLSGFTGSGGLLMNLASTTALELQDGVGTSMFTVDTTNASSTVAGTFRIDRRSGGTETLLSVASSTQEIFTVKSDGTAAFTGDVAMGDTVLDPVKGINAAPVPFEFHPLYSINPVMYGAATPNATLVVKDPSVVLGASNAYMYYSYGSDVTGAFDLAYAKSSAPGKFDFVHQGVAIPRGADGSYDEIGAFSASPPILVDGTYYMWYTAVKDVQGDNSTDLAAQVPWSIALATAASLNGPWTKADDLVIDGSTTGHCMDPWVLTPAQSPDGMYRMYISQRDATLGYRVVNLYRATTPTGPWTKYGIAFDPQAQHGAWPAGDDVENPAVVRHGNWWYLTVDDAVKAQSHLAVSSDGGLSFHEADAGILSAYGRPDSFDTQAADALSPFFVGDYLYAAYQAYSWIAHDWTISIAELGRTAHHPMIGKTSTHQMLRGSDTPATVITTNKSANDITETAWTVYVANAGWLVVDCSFSAQVSSVDGSALYWLKVGNAVSVAHYITSPTANAVGSFHARFAAPVKAGLNVITLRTQVLTGSGSDVLTLAEMEWIAEERITY